MDKNKVLYVNSTFTKELPSASEAIDSIYIEGYASTTDIDRAGDVISKSVWEEGIKNYLKNPIILAQHEHDDPIGRMVEHKIDETGLWVKARISAAAEIFNLVKDGVVTAFSVGFRILDAEYNAAAEIFLVTKLELVEISVVSVPCNQNTLFSLSKAFDNAEEYKSFKSQFVPKSESAKGLESSTEANSISQKEWKMDPKEIEKMVADAVKAAADAATKAANDANTKALEDKAAKDVADAAVAEQIRKAVAAVTPTETGTEKLLKDVEARFAAQADTTKSAIAGLEAALAEKAKEIEAMQKSKMTFTDNGGTGPSKEEKEAAVIVAKMAGKGLEETKYFKDLVVKYGQHLPNATLETEVSLNLETEIRRKLVVAPLLRAINMKTNVMKIPVNPDTTLAAWVTNANFGAVPGGLGLAGPSAGVTQVHVLKEITLSAFKVAANEYMAFEEDEDALIAIAPIIRDSLVRKVARQIDRTFLIGDTGGTDPFKGLANYDVTSAVSSSAGTPVTTLASKLRALRSNMGMFGVDPSDVIYVVSTEFYFELLEDTNFMTMDKVGDKASILTGQIGMVGGSPVLVSGEFPTKAGSATLTLQTNIGAVAFNKPNFIVGNQRGLRFDTQDLVETQRRIMVASLRTGLVQISNSVTDGASGVSTFRWAV